MSKAHGLREVSSWKVRVCPENEDPLHPARQAFCRGDLGKRQFVGLEVPNHNWVNRQAGPIGPEVFKNVLEDQSKTKMHVALRSRHSWDVW